MDEQDEATRAAIERWREDGSDLSRPMRVDFFVAVPDEDAGHAVVKTASTRGFDTSVERDDQGRWTCYCTKTIVPSYATVRGIEHELDALARAVGGHSDGFGSFGNAEDRPD